MGSVEGEGAPGEALERELERTRREVDLIQTNTNSMW